ncbi:exonuclease SbcD [Clostridium tetanomorphum]|uniref:Nuclease SbcCD subunit D n=1 Tax=Clostridium tetanomorphum TaxID=1553 RepID=A0A923J323_CLOTT|nr:exonuclease SbcCD subunit D [Clostridium tetanomorphum]KAJ51870.1 exonuclease SbcD [Clostridium tetanomorphum DSM 665]MBC2399520.1 exonuclease SbcCD subunit D [Clostridium tetanomorphum]MBP1864127.1 exonuclease SbcD [Clostridium tetanomorphum]NRS84540.1 exonuclease SbcD [Clostridium tetanomorphum]NRZ97754.1 exonuclease SbcD [Clostridium tetanomorphum]
MKIVHTGDWHIGKIVNEFSMIEEQEYILKKLINIIEEEEPDALVIAGDLYDRSIPTVEAINLLNKVFNKILLQLKIPILTIAGNHDSGERLSFGSEILIKNGLYIAGILDSDIRKVVLYDESEPVNFYLIPYADPREVRNKFEDKEINNHDTAMKKIIEKIKNGFNENEKNVIVAHGYVTFMKDIDKEITEEENYKRAGLETSDSERPLSIGGTDLIDGKYFEAFNYTALGHLHRPQKVGKDTIRYSGSLLKYSFSEANHKKGVNIVNIKKNGEVTIEFKELIPKRDMRIIKGPINELVNPEVYKKTNTEDFVFAVLTDEGELMDPISKLRTVYSNIMGLSRINMDEREKSKTSASLRYENKSKVKLFQEFYEDIEGIEITKEKIDIIEKVVEEVNREEK